jgi:hypothetical protein
MHACMRNLEALYIDLLGHSGRGTRSSANSGSATVVTETSRSIVKL